MLKRYTVVDFLGDDGMWVVHKVGCPKIAEEMASTIEASKRTIKLDLDWEDDELLEAVDPYDKATGIEDVELCACTGYETPEPTTPSPARPAAIASREAAQKRLLQQVEEAIDKLVIARGVDDVGEGDLWADQRLPSCTDDYVYDLAVEVRKLREKGEAWWRVGHELGLPGSGASNKQGRKGSAFARRVWRAAWGKTYLGERGQRESKATREVRAMENLGRPYFSEDATEQEIVKRITGQMIHWVARLEGRHGIITSAQEAYVHDNPRLVRYKLGPLGPYVEFYEQVDPAQLRVDPRLSIAKSGPIRSVYVNRITRVGV
jgi:hypothetical protein